MRAPSPRLRLRIARLLALALLLGVAPAGAQTVERIGAEGGDFRATLSDGRVLRGAELVGGTLRLAVDGQPVALRIDAAEPDRGGHAPDVWLFRLTLVGTDGARRDLCQPDPDGRSLAIPYPDGAGGVALTCSAGAIGKCFRFGYRPWAVAADGTTSLAPYHAACVNMVRGAYGGPEHAFTRTGMRIDLYDRIGIQQPDLAPDDAFEAGWTPEGAACVAHPRVPENGSLAAIVAAVPRLSGLTGPEACTEEMARARGSLLFNRSRPPG